MKIQTGVWFLAFLIQVTGTGQQIPAAFTTNQAVQQAVEEHPTLRAANENAASATAGVDLTRTAHLPRVDFVGQVNRATRNNVFGLILLEALE